jgi:hypothetical protein
MGWEGHVAGMGSKINAYRILVRKPEGRRILGKSSRKWNFDNRIDVKEIRQNGMEWIYMYH